MSPAEALPWQPGPELKEVKKEGEPILPEELLLAMDAADALKILVEETTKIQAALLTKRPISPEVGQILGAFFDADKPEAQALRLLADELVRARIFAERRSETPRGPRLVQ